MSEDPISNPQTVNADRHDREHERILVLGANGPTGRETVQQALHRGYRVDALTRHPEVFPLAHERLTVVTGDATNSAVIDAAVADVDAVICSIGAAFTRQPDDVYSASARLLLTALSRSRSRRLVVVTSAGLGPAHDRMAKMEALVSASDLDWTIVRPPGLVTLPGLGYAAAENQIDGSVCAREDLARMLLDQLDDDRFARKIAAVTTPGLTVSARHMIWHEMLKR